MKSNNSFKILTVTLITLLIVVILGIYKFYESDYWGNSISSDKKEFNGDLIDGFGLNIEYDVRVKLIDGYLNYIVNFTNISPHTDYEDRLKSISVYLMDEDYFKLSQIDLSKPVKQYVNSEKYYSSGKIKLSKEKYELIESCHFSIYFLNEEESLIQKQTENKNLFDWYSFLSIGMTEKEVIELIGIPDFKREGESIWIYDVNKSFHTLEFNEDKTLSSWTLPIEYRWNQLRRGQTTEFVKEILGNPHEIVYENLEHTKWDYYYPDSNQTGWIRFDKDSKIITFKSPN